MEFPSEASARELPPEHPARAPQRAPHRAGRARAWPRSSRTPYARRLRPSAAPRTLSRQALAHLRSLLKARTQLAHLDGRPRGSRAFAGNGDSLRPTGARQQEDAADHFARFGERPIAHESPVAVRGHSDRSARVGERLAEREQTPALETCAEL